VPYFRFVGEADVPIDKVIARLTPHVAARKWLSWKRPDTEFEGSVSQRGFSLNKIISGRDSFNPLIVGRFAALASGTRVTVQMYLHPFVLAFCCFISYLMAPEAWKALNGLPGGDRGVLLMLAVVWAATVILFYVNAQRIKGILINELGLHGGNG